MSSILILLTSLCSVGQSALTKSGASKCGDNAIMRFNAVKMGVFSLAFLLLFGRGMQIHLPTILLASLYGISLFLSTHFGSRALVLGPMSLTSLIASYSVVIPFFFGIIFFNESATAVKFLGILLLLVSMLLLKKRSGDSKFGKGWVMCIAITFLFNGISSVIQKVHQTLYPASFTSEFTLCSFLAALVLFSAISLIRRESGSCSPKFAAAAGILLGASNFLTLTLAGKMDASVLYPMITVFSMLFNILISRLVFKDKLSLIQLFGIALGVTSVLIIR